MISGFELMQSWKYGNLKGSSPHAALQAWHRIDVKGYGSQAGH